mmetsp:Transcript_38287/g.90398  ORF Transcript_38287/g.90398 Transcript_38287/m.90398 type:complete len:92 (+) Transcript_38287:193-468(+)
MCVITTCLCGCASRYRARAGGHVVRRHLDLASPGCDLATCREILGCFPSPAPPLPLPLFLLFLLLLLPPPLLLACSLLRNLLADELVGVAR